MALAVIRALPIRMLLIILFVLQIVFAVGAAGYISFQNGRKTVDDMAGQLCSEIILHVKQHVDTYLETAETINSINLGELRQGLLTPGNTSQLARYFWEQGKVFRGLGTIAFADIHGTLIGANEPENYLVLSHKNLTGGAIRRYASDNKGGFSGAVLRERPDYDPRTREWYLTAVSKGGPAWAGISMSVTGARLDLTAASPYYDERRVLQGVLYTDLSLSQISSFLGSLSVGRTGQVFIMERNGFIVASSYKETPYVSAGGPGEEIRRLPAVDSKSPLIAASARKLAGQSGGLISISSHQRSSLDIGGRRHFIQAMPYQKDGLNFLIVAVIPEADFLQHVKSNNRTTLLLSIAALLLALGLAFWTSEWVVTPIRKLAGAARSFGKGNWEEQAVPDRSDEVGSGRVI